MNLNEEIICGYTVSAKMKKIWSVEIDLLKDFIRVCSKHNLRYYVVDGTLLGCVRHKGFIPWDNDVDVAMPRPDFNELLKLGPSEFSNPHFFQSTYTENGNVFMPFVKIRDDFSTGGGYDEYMKGIHCGIFIDVFPFDEIPNNFMIRKLYLHTLNVIRYMSYFCCKEFNKTGIKNKIIYKFRQMIYKYLMSSPDANKLFDIYNKSAGKYWERGNKYIADLSFGYQEQLTWVKADWDDTVNMPFEDIDVIAPKNYENILIRQYGDYMEIPEDKSTHDYYVFDADVDYKTFFSGDR